MFLYYERQLKEVLFYEKIYQPLALLILTLAYAVDAGNYSTRSVMSPQFTYIWQMSAGLGINSSGKANYAGSVDVASME